MDKQSQIGAQQHSRNGASQPVNPAADEEMSSTSPKGRQRNQKNSFPGINYPTEAEMFELRSHVIMPLLGYGLLLLALFDYVTIIYPPQFTNPAWELKTIGDLVEHVAIPLLGILFIFYRDHGHIAELEKNVLAFLSWVCLLAGLMYLLMLPLGVADTWRLYQANKVQVFNRASLQQQQFQKAKGQLNQARTDEQIKRVVISLNPEVRPRDIQDPQAFKEEFLAQISRGEREVQRQAKKTWSDQSQTLLENSIKWNLGALVSGTLFIVIWRLTDWVRRKEY